MSTEGLFTGPLSPVASPAFGGIAMTGELRIEHSKSFDQPINLNALRQTRSHESSPLPFGKGL